MATADPFPIFYPGDARPAFTQPDYVRRLAKECLVDRGAKVLVLGVGTGAVALQLAKDLGAQVTAADASAERLSALEERARTSGVQERLSTRAVRYDALGFEPRQFDAIFVDALPPLPLGALAEKLRPLLQLKGRACLAYPVKVGRLPSAQSLAFWGKRLGEPLRLPREALMALEKSGFEPQLVETLGDEEMEAFYAAVEAGMGVAAADPRLADVREEIALHRAQGARLSVSLAVMVVRRKDPGERPPVARSE